MRNHLPFKTLAAFAAMLIAAGFARAQDTARERTPSAQQKPATKPHKVWTEDDVAALRPPVDCDTTGKDAQVVVEASAKAGTPTSVGLQPSTQAKQPSTLEESERAIKDLLADISDQRDTLERLSKELREIPEDQKVERTREIDRRSVVLQESQKELKALQDRRGDLARTAALANSVSREVTSASATPSCKVVSSSCPY